MQNVTIDRRILFCFYVHIICTYTEWLVTGGTSGKGVILREENSTLKI